MYQRILVPINGSATSDLALQEAIKIANDTSQIRLVCVHEEIVAISPEGFDSINNAALQEAAIKDAERILAMAAETAKKAGIKAETILLDTLGLSIADIINNEAQRWQADLIVIGTHGRTGLTRLILGSVAEGVVREATVPVLLIRGEG